MIDWRLASIVANGLLSAQQPPDAVAPPGLFEHAREAEGLVSGYTGLTAAGLPAAEIVSREEWIEANLKTLGAVLDPVAARMGENLGPFSGAANAVGGAVIGVEAGVISGLLASRVLGQLEFPLLDPDAPARLMFVGPNLGAAARGLDAAPDELGRWVALHESTHALQFAGVPWLRSHLAGLVGELMQGLRVDPVSLLRLPRSDDLRSLVDSAREGGLAVLLLGPDRRALVDRVQAFMAVLEGYAEHVMDVVGADVLGDLDSLRDALDRRRRERSGPLKVLERLIGLELKLRQYEQGKKFCDTVVSRGGIGALNRVWEGPDRLPTLAELDNPSGWLARTAPAAA
jgi:coenzyme F420 biosynthesis associated uncharacterized protein